MIPPVSTAITLTTINICTARLPAALPMQAAAGALL